MSAFESILNDSGFGNAIPVALEGSSLRDAEAAFPYLSLADRSSELILLSEQSFVTALQLSSHAEGRFQAPAFALLRTALENVAQVSWMLSADSSPERIQRLCLLEREDLRNAENYYKADDRGGSDESIRGRERTELLKAVNQFLQSGPERGLVKPPTATQMVEYLDQSALATEAGLRFTAAWRLLSGLIHGTGWARVAAGPTSSHPGLITIPSIDTDTTAKLFSIAAAGIIQAHWAYSQISGISLAARMTPLSVLIPEGNTP